MHAIAYRGVQPLCAIACIKICAVRGSALEVDPGRIIPCRTLDSNPCQYCAWLFSLTLYQLSYPPPPPPIMSVVSCTVVCVGMGGNISDITHTGSELFVICGRNGQCDVSLMAFSCGRNGQFDVSVMAFVWGRNGQFDISVMAFVCGRNGQCDISVTTVLCGRNGQCDISVMTFVCGRNGQCDISVTTVCAGMDSVTAVL